MNKSIFKILLNDDNVNLYTKVYLLLYRINYYDNRENYIPNQLIMNTFKIDKYVASKIIKKMIDNNIIRTYFIGSKRYFQFIDKDFEYMKKNKKEKKYNDILSYDWLNDDF